MFQKMATIYCKSWVPNKMNVGGYWLSLNQLDGYVWGKDAPYEAFRRSCVNNRNFSTIPAIQKIVTNLMSVTSII